MDFYLPFPVEAAYDSSVNRTKVLHDAYTNTDVSWLVDLRQCSTVGWSVGIIVSSVGWSSRRHLCLNLESILPIMTTILHMKVYQNPTQSKVKSKC